MLKKCLTAPTLLETGFFTNDPLEMPPNSTALIDLFSHHAYHYANRAGSRCVEGD